VRCIYRNAEKRTSYEERITLWRAESFEIAIERAESEAREYAELVNLRYLGFAQANRFAEEPGDGVEVFSLYRDSDLDSEDYLNTFFDTGTERQGHVG
jgi:hypothetical protein